MKAYRACLFDEANGERMYNPTTLIVNGLIPHHVLPSKKNSEWINKTTPLIILYMSHFVRLYIQWTSTLGRKTFNQTPDVVPLNI